MNTTEQIEELLQENEFSNIKVVEFENHGIYYNMTFQINKNKQVTENTMQKLFNSLDMRVVEFVHGTSAAYLQVTYKDGLND